MGVPEGYPNPNPQSVLVIGAGAVGCLYGGRLLEAGHDVAFLMRREYEAVKEKARGDAYSRSRDAYLRCSSHASAFCVCVVLLPFGWQGLKITSPDGDLYFPSPTLVRSTRDYTELRCVHARSD